MMIFVPIFFPVVINHGYSAIWFGVAITIGSEMGLITPPVGLNVYTIKGVAPDVPLSTIFRGVWPFVLCMVVLIFLLLIFPGIADFLPRFMMY
jgi:TRAP-type C4-dicarboxylate transport system permease large subunit